MKKSGAVPHSHSKCFSHDRYFVQKAKPRRSRKQIRCGFQSSFFPLEREALLTALAFLQFEWRPFHRAVALLNEDLDFTLRLLQFGVAKTGQRYSLLEQLQCRSQRQVATFQSLDNFLQSL